MRPAPVVSIVIPVFDSADVVAEAVESAVVQELDVALEIVAVDDGSADESVAVLQRLAARYPAVLRIDRHRHNRGGGAARNTGIRAAHGSFIRILDADNVLPPGVIQAELERLLEGREQVVSVDEVRYFRGHAEGVSHAWQMAGHEGRSRLIDAFTSIRVPGAHGNYLFARDVAEAVGGYEEARGAMDTWTFGLKHLAHGYEIGLVPGQHYLHRIERPHHMSYWTREQRAGHNDANAIATVLELRDHLPEDLAAKLDFVESDDPLFELINVGAFAWPDDRFLRELKRARRRQRSVWPRLQQLLGVLRSAMAPNQIRRR